MKLQFTIFVSGLLLLGYGCTSSGSETHLSGRQVIAGPYESLTAVPAADPISCSPDPLVAYRWDHPQASDDLESYVLTPVSILADDPRHVRWSSDDKLPVTVEEPCTLMFDFGQVNAGWLELDAEGLEGSDVRMSISEFTEPAVFNAGSQHPYKTAVPVCYDSTARLDKADKGQYKTYRLELNDQLYEGVRYGWLHVDRQSSPFTISAVRLVCQIKPTNYEGRFACSDTTLTRIWYTGAYTVKLNLLKDYFGAILMERSDRHSWTGDAHPSQAASMVAFGNYDFVKKNLYYTSTQFNGIAGYSLYWVLSLLDYYNYTGDTATLDSLTANACRKLDVAWTHFGQRPSLQFYGWDERLGAGFERPDCDESQQAYQMLSLRAWNEFSRAMAQRGRDSLSSRYRGYVDEKLRELRKQQDWYGGYGIFAASDAVNADFADASEQEGLWNTAFTDRMQRLSYSPFNQYFIIQAMARLGRYDEALTTIDDLWGGQIRYGGTTFFEVYRPSWNDAIPVNGAPVNNQCGYTSLTHPWSAGVTRWLSEEILGVKPLTPGFATFRVSPHLNTQVTSVSGQVPTLHEVIEVSYDLCSGAGSLKVPSGTVAEVGIPKAGRTIRSVICNGQTIVPTSEDQRFVWMKEVPAGDYTLEVAYEGELPDVQKESLLYAYPSPALQDSTTKGNWQERYGKSGYVLCNYDGVGKDRVRLPDFVERVAFNKRGDVVWVESGTDSRALVSDQQDEHERRLGAVITRDPAPCDQTLTVDILSKERKPYRVSLYFVDWEEAGRRSAVEVFDAQSKQLLMPVQVVKNYAGGKYLTLHLDRPVRLRLDQVRGVNAALSGLFFDE